MLSDEVTTAGVSSTSLLQMECSLARFFGFLVYLVHIGVFVPSIADYDVIHL